MNTLCLENYGVSEMEIPEIKTVEGGWVWTFMPTIEAFREWYGSDSGMSEYC